MPPKTLVNTTKYENSSLLWPPETKSDKESRAIDDALEYLFNGNVENFWNE